jgi:predicted metal-dependent peptidase
MGKKPKVYNNQPAKGKKGKEWLRQAAEKFEDGSRRVYRHSLFNPLMANVRIIHVETKTNLCPPEGWAVVTNNGDIYVNPFRMAEPDEWQYVLAHCLLHLGFDHFQQQFDSLRWNVACDRVITRFLQEFKFGKAPEAMNDPIDSGTRDEHKLYDQLLQANLTESLQIYSTVGFWHEDMLFEPERDWRNQQNPDWAALFGHGLANAVTQVVEVVSGHDIHQGKQKSDGNLCKTWFLNHFPLLGALAATFEVIEDATLCQRMSISVAAVDAEAGKIYMNPAAFSAHWDGTLRQEEYRFVMAHELLHVSLRHHARRQGRDPYLWNVACDYVINSWLIEMGVGSMPKFGLLYDPQLKDLNVETVYDRITGDLRMYRKRPSLQSKLKGEFTTFRGKGGCDILDGSIPEWWTTADGATLDDFYRRALAQGFQYHVGCGRGLLPAGLIEEIMAVGRPPIRWDVELAQWFDAHFPPLETRRTYARPSRRQSSTPDIPRPRYVKEPVDEQSRTFGVVLDTSGSMERELLAKMLGSIASYAIARDVPFVRVVFCDAYAYDQGYLAPETIAGRVKVKGRGGTVLMPGVQLLESAEDFPDNGPILVITDTECDRVMVKAPHDHAFLVPRGKSLPFHTHAPVFFVD